MISTTPDFLATVLQCFGAVTSANGAMFSRISSCPDAAAFGRSLAKHGLAFPLFFPMEMRRLPDFEFDSLTSLLEEYLQSTEEDARWLPRMIAAACLEDGHLSRNMGLPDRNTLTRLFRKYFPALHALNTENVRWKKFLYQLRAQRHLDVLRMHPGCRMCEEYADCFDPDA